MKKSPEKPAKKAVATTSPKRKKIFLVDDHPMMRAGLAQLINRQPDMVISAEAGQPVEVFRQIDQVQPDLILTDLTMPGRSGLEFIKDLIAYQSNILILVISMHDEVIYAERCLRAGARGYIMKEAGSEKLLAAPSLCHGRPNLRQPRGVRKHPGKPVGQEAPGLRFPHSGSQ